MEQVKNNQSSCSFGKNNNNDDKNENKEGGAEGGLGGFKRTKTKKFDNQ